MLSAGQSLDSLRVRIEREGVPPALFLEQNFKLTEVLAMRKMISIQDIGETLTEISKGVFSFETPHPYMNAGAPYGDASPYYLRAKVTNRLVIAQSKLSEVKPGHRLHIFDGYRPQTVQKYMRDVDFRRFAIGLGFEANHLTPEQEISAWAKVDCLWARPSSDPQLPPPHSTGAALDVTIVNEAGTFIPMGSEFDESSERILPHHYQDKLELGAVEICENRELLNRVMENAGFRRLTHEWWHFSYGDQMWALLQSLITGESVRAMYGEFTVNKSSD